MNELRKSLLIGIPVAAVCLCFGIVSHSMTFTVAGIAVAFVVTVLLGKDDEVSLLAICSADETRTILRNHRMIAYVRTPNVDFKPLPKRNRIQGE